MQMIQLFAFTANPSEEVELKLRGDEEGLAQKLLLTNGPAGMS